MPLPPLDGRQHAVAYMSAAGHYVVQGTAGSGKTVMAVVRAAHLVNLATPNNGSTLLLTHDNSLVKYIRRLTSGLTDEVVVETYHKFARGYLASMGLMRRNCIGEAMDSYVAEAIAAVQLTRPTSQFLLRPVKFFIDELDWISGMGFTTATEYFAATRVGRIDPLGPKRREIVWQLRDAYLLVLAKYGKLYDWASIAGALRRALEGHGAGRKYRHIVVDEAQDLAPEAIRSLALSIQPGGSLTLFVDDSQQIYGQRTSWRSCGLTVPKVEIFSENYRNTPQIAAVAIAMATMDHFNDTPDIVVPVAPRRAAGTRPTLFRANSADSEIAEVRKQAASFGKSSRVAVLAHTRAEARRAVAGISDVKMLSKDMPAWDDNPGVFYGTYYAAKGLEFEVVILPFTDRGKLPDPEAIGAFGEREAKSRESRLLYVGVTRARSELLVTYVHDLTELLPSASEPLWTVVIEK